MTTTYSDFYRAFSTPEWRQRVNGWLHDHLLDVLKFQTPKAIEKFKTDYAQQVAKNPDWALHEFWKQNAAARKNPDWNPEAILNQETPIKDEDILPDNHKTIQEALQLWQQARHTSDQVRAIEGLDAADITSGLPPDFVDDLIAYGSPEVAKAARRLRVQAPSGNTLTMQPKQALQFFRTQGIPLDNLSLSSATLLDFHYGDGTMWELDFRAKTAKIGTVDRAGEFQSVKRWPLNDKTLHALVPIWKKNL